MVPAQRGRAEAQAPQWVKAVVFEHTALQAAGFSGEISALGFELPSSGGLWVPGTLSQGLDVPAFSTLQTGGREDAVLLAT